jgi:hypothetical protein
MEPAAATGARAVLARRQQGGAHAGIPCVETKVIARNRGWTSDPP